MRNKFPKLVYIIVPLICFLNLSCVMSLVLTVHNEYDHGVRILFPIHIEESRDGVLENYPDTNLYVLGAKETKEFIIRSINDAYYGSYPELRPMMVLSIVGDTLEVQRVSYLYFRVQNSEIFFPSNGEVYSTMDRFWFPLVRSEPMQSYFEAQMQFNGGHYDSCLTLVRIIRPASLMAKYNDENSEWYKRDMATAIFRGSCIMGLLAAEKKNARGDIAFYWILLSKQFPKYSKLLLQFDPEISKMEYLKTL